MNDYKAAYENYYRNINKKSNLKIQEERERNLFPIKNREINYKKNDSFQNILSKEYWIKCITRQTIASMIIILFLFGVKCLPLEYTKSLYVKCRNTLNTDLTYNQSIEVLKDIKIGTFKGKDFNIDGFTFDDLKKENIKKEFLEYNDYIKNNSFENKAHERKE